MITEDYVSFEVAKLLKEKGFDEECRAFYVKSKECGIELFPSDRNHNYNDDVYPCTSAPTLWVAMKWLREEKGIPIEILWHYDADSDIEEWYFIHHAELRILPNDIEYYETYEEACESAIKYCLKNLI